MLSVLLLSFCLSWGSDVPIPADEDPFRVSEEMKQFLAANIGHGSDTVQQLETLVRLVFQENALHFTYEPLTRTAAETFNKRSGNCVSFTFLFLAMARHLGMNAQFREVDIVPIWSRVGNIISMSGHANAAVSIGSQVYIIDLFPQVNRVQLGGRIVSDARALAHFFSNRGVNQLADGNPPGAVAYFQKSVESDPATAFAWANLGVAETLVGNFEEGEKAYLKALKLAPGELVAMSNLAALYERLGRSREAKAFTAKVTKFQLKNPYYHFSLGLQDYQSGDYRASLEHYKAALKRKSTEHLFYLGLAKAHAQLGEMQKATANLKLAAKYAPDELSKHRYNEKLALLASLQSRL